MIKTRAATIGVRGTTFIISENNEQNGESVALKEGLLQIESNGPAFEIHKKRIPDEFEQFKLEQQKQRQELQDEFERYKQQTMQEFVEYRREFTLRPNRVINLSGYRVDETAMTESNKADFESFETEAEDLIKNFRARSKGLIAQ
jgi:predicted nuclease with TOPRIM domain